MTEEQQTQLVTIAAAAARFLATANAEASGHACAPTAQECCRDLYDALLAAGIDPLQFIRFYPEETPA
ncbi:MAG TPA: hypothetical protein VFL91_26455 [Thermomicrobiales bacterium]|nr:hypothetical protein [Thermomicrobiales bacterium]